MYKLKICEYNNGAGICTCAPETPFLTEKTRDLPHRSARPLELPHKGVNTESSILTNDNCLEVMNSCDEPVVVSDYGIGPELPAGSEPKPGSVNDP